MVVLETISERDEATINMDESKTDEEIVLPKDQESEQNRWEVITNSQSQSSETPKAKSLKNNLQEQKP